MLDAVLELWLRLLALHIEESSEEKFIGREIRDNWLLASKVYFTGCVPDCLESAVSTDHGRDVVIKAINSLIAAIEKGPEKLDHETLNLLGFDDFGFMYDIESRRLLEIGNAFLDLINGKIQSEASSTNFMPGCR